MLYAFVLIAFGILNVQSSKGQAVKLPASYWLQEMQMEEQKIYDFTQQKVKSDGDREWKRILDAAVGEGKICSEDNIAAAKDRVLEAYFREAYFSIYPEALAIYNPGRVLASEAPGFTDNNQIPSVSCTNGNFESGTAAGYNGYVSLYTGGVCGFVPAGSVAYTPVGFSNPQNFLITNNGPDPLVPALNMTHNNSNHAIRVNDPTGVNSGINMLQKQIPVTTNGQVKVNFSYALVMQDPGHINANPFFVARVLNSGGTEVGNRICRVADLLNPVYNVYNNMVWRDWSCASIIFDGQAGQTYTLEFFMADCGVVNGQHFGYAYIDDICTEIECCGRPKNLRCKAYENGDKQLSWNSVTNVLYYQLFLAQDDPACCGSSDPGSLVYAWNVYGADTVVSASLGCFSWRVRAICKDDVISEFSDLECSCNYCPPPSGLKCEVVGGQNQLSWTAVPGAAHYRVLFSYYDPACCYSIVPPTMFYWDVFGTDTVVAPSYGCFSWSVVTVCEDSSVSDAPSWLCSCKKCPVPYGLNCVAEPEGHRISWSPVPGAALYKVEFEINDTLCCDNGLPPMLNIWEVYGTDTLVPYNLYGCFSWRVISVCGDGSYSDPSPKSCSCAPDCVAPVNLRCEPEETGSHLFWDMVPGAMYYRIEFEINDTLCCNNGIPPMLNIWEVYGTDTLVPYNLYGCFSWRVISVCGDGIYSSPSPKSCSCAPDCVAPVNLRCEPEATGSHLFWDMVPGAIYYRIEFEINDTLCCNNGIPPMLNIWEVYGTDTLVPYNLYGCFSWRVMSICQDGSVSSPSPKSCSCAPDCIAPSDLRCEPEETGSHLFWNMVPGAMYYRIEFEINDTLCCNNGIPPMLNIWEVYGTDTLVPYNLYGCFSWRVISVCGDGLYSDPSPKSCSCAPGCVAPSDLRCEPEETGSHLFWNMVPGAMYYRIEFEINDTFCCNNGIPPMLNIWEVYGTDTLVPYNLYGCFSWRVISVCGDGLYSDPSPKSCSCAPDCVAPSDLRCEPEETGSHLFWDMVPGAMYYRIEFEINDTLCCNNGIPPMLNIWEVYGTDTIVPYTLYECFSWKVMSVCQDGSVSPPSPKSCSCAPEFVCDPPYLLGCESLDFLSRLYWNAVPGAAYYKLYIELNDPQCCPGGITSLQVFSVYGTDTILYNTFNECYSWWVQTVCVDSSTSVASSVDCSCSMMMSRIPAEETKTEDLPDRSSCILVAPNPASSYIDFAVPEGCPDKELFKAAVLYVYDVNGNLIIKKPMDGKPVQRISVSDCVPGIYSYKLTDSRGSVLYSDKFIVAK